jgi:CRP-like cAMP-binding protein
MDLTESYARYAVRYWLLDFGADDPTDSIVRTRVFFALKRANIPLSIPAHALFVTEESDERRKDKVRREFDQRMAVLARVELFAKLSEDERRRLADGLHDAPFAAGETITRQGAVAHWLYMVLDGEASVRVAVDETEREVARLSAGDFFGEMGLLTGERRTATVVAMTRVHCYRLDRDVFKALLDNRPKLAEQVADVLARRTVELSAARLGLDRGSADAIRVTRTDLLDKIRDFFSLEDAPKRKPK